MVVVLSGGPGDPVGWDAQLTLLTNIAVCHAVAPPCVSPTPLAVGPI